MKYSIIIPCFNSVNFIEKKINILVKFLNKLSIKYEIIIIDDCSNDGTFYKLLKIEKKNNNIIIIKNNKNFGKSHSIIKGINKSHYEKIILIDADLPYLHKLSKIIIGLNKYDLIIIDRRHEKSKNLDTKINSYQFLRIKIGILINKIIRLFISIDYKDTQAGLKGFIKPNNFSKLKFVSKKFFFDLELILFFHKMKKKIKTIPTHYRISRNSSIKIFDLNNNIEILYELFRVLFKKL
jgi:glycosyltransferase involved in cell wall biosynthesis